LDASALLLMALLLLLMALLLLLLLLLLLGDRPRCSDALCSACRQASNVLNSHRCGM
jgi:hypothetical protein